MSIDYKSFLLPFFQFELFEIRTCHTATKIRIQIRNDICLICVIFDVESSWV